MNLDWTPILAAFTAGMATALGAIPIYFKKEFSKKVLNMGLGFSAGIMLVASFVSLILPGIEQAENVYSSTIAFPTILFGILSGYLFIIVVHEILPHEHIFKNKDMNHGQNLSRINLLVLAICIHNIPEGLAVGVGFGTDNLSAGLTLAFAIAIQNMPEGLVVALGLLSEGTSKNKAFVMAMLSGLVEPVAAIFGYLSASFSIYSLPVALGFAGGTMLFVICQEIFPEVFRQGQQEKSTTLGVITGIIAMLSIDYYF